MYYVSPAPQEKRADRLVKQKSRLLRLDVYRYSVICSVCNEGIWRHRTAHDRTQKSTAVVAPCSGSTLGSRFKLNMKFHRFFYVFIYFIYFFYYTTEQSNSAPDYYLTHAKILAYTSLFSLYIAVLKVQKRNGDRIPDVSIKLSYRNRKGCMVFLKNFSPQAEIFSALRLGLLMSRARTANLHCHGFQPLSFSVSCEISSSVSFPRLFFTLHCGYFMADGQVV